MLPKSVSNIELHLGHTIYCTNAFDLIPIALLAVLSVFGKLVISTGSSTALNSVDLNHIDVNRNTFSRNNKSADTAASAN